MNWIPKNQSAAFAHVRSLIFSISWLSQTDSRLYTLCAYTKKYHAAKVFLEKIKKYPNTFRVPIWRRCIWWRQFARAFQLLWNAIKLHTKNSSFCCCYHKKIHRKLFRSKMALAFQYKYTKLWWTFLISFHFFLLFSFLLTTNFGVQQHPIGMLSNEIHCAIQYIYDLRLLYSVVSSFEFCLL